MSSTAMSNTDKNNRNAAEHVAETYYDSRDADTFYERVWGGEDIHIGLYSSENNQPDPSIFEASRRTVERIASKLQSLNATSKVLDLGAGYGGAARYLATTFGCHVTCLNLSKTQNQRNRELNKQQNLEDKVEVLHGSFEDVPCEHNSFDIVWSQDAFLHSGDRCKVVAEINRVLKPQGEVIFTDPMQADNCPPNVLQPVYDRLALESLASVALYREQFSAAGFEEVEVELLTDQLGNHYTNVRQQLIDRYDELVGDISNEYLDKMIQGLENWVKAKEAGYLAWGILHFKKP